MPKIIEGVRDLILEKAEEMMKESDYKSFSARNLANACGIAVGTIYNYFPSMDELLMTIITENWRKTFEETDRRCEEAASIADAFCELCSGIRSFSSRYYTFWNSSMIGGFALSSGTGWMESLNRFVCKRVDNILGSRGYSYNKSLTPAIAEVIIALGSKCTLDFNIAVTLLRQATECIESSSKQSK